MNDSRELLADDQHARERALDTRRSFIVQAPAGSGKTELLIQRYLHLLATVENPEEVLAITFTRKAAAEMRLRVIEALQRAARGEQPDAAHLQVTARAANRVLERDEALDWRLIRNPRRLRILTLDSFNASVSRLQPLTSSAAGAGGSVVDEGQMARLYDDAAVATLDWLADVGANGDATREVLLHVDNNTGIYTSYLARMLRTRDQWLPFVSSGLVTDQEARELRRLFESSLARVVTERLEQLAASVPLDAAAEFLALAVYAGDRLRADGKHDHPVCRLGHEPALPPATPDALAQWHAMAELLLTRSGSVRKQVNKNLGFPPGDDGQKKAMQALLESLADESVFASQLHAARSLPPVQYSDEQWSVLLALFRLLPVAVAELRRLCLAQGVTDHIEVALSAAKALGTAEQPGDAALLLDYQVRHILVDEMQDTSKAQYRMLEALTGGWQEGDGRTLFCVGDPMQSIYRFRNAEVAQFLLARHSGIGSVRLEPLLLRRNFRSGEHLVDWFNRVFPTVLPPFDDPGSGAVSYSEAVSVDMLAGQGACHVHPVFGGSVQAEAAIGAGVVRELLDSDPDESVAVLVRSRTQLPALLRELREAGIPYQAIDIDRLTDLPEIIDILALTRAGVHPGDRVAWLGVLRAAWIGLDWRELHALVYNAPHAAVLDLVNDPERRRVLSDDSRTRLEQALPVLQRLVAADRSAPLHRKVERAWFALGGPAALADNNAVENVYHFLDTLADIETAGTLADTAALMTRLDADRVSTNAAARVQVLTMHKAKGLQFDHVVLYALGRYPSGSNKAVMNWFDLPSVHGDEDKVISPIGRRDAVEHDPVHRFIEMTQAGKDRYEQGRLLYVACTRARKSLHLVGNTALESDGSGFRPPYASSLLRLLWSVTEPDYAAAFDRLGEDPEPDELPDRLLPARRRFRTAWASPTPPDVPGQQIQADADNPDRVEYYWVGADARLAGTVVHRWLQQAAEGKIALDALSTDALRATSKRWLQELGAGHDSIEPICQRVAAALTAVRGSERGRWLLDGDGYAELALSGLVGGGVESIVIDRVRIDDDGTHWIVDYKTGSHEGGGLQSFLAAEIERYTPQLSKYAQIYAAYRDVPIRCALYFPLLSEFVEVSVGQ